MVSGLEEARRAVREQIGRGADLIKVYADWSHPTLTVEEMRVVVEEAHKQGRKVASHAMTPEGIRNAVSAGVDSIEHGHGADRQTLELMKEKGTFLVPTVGVVDFMDRDHKGSSTLQVPTLIRDALSVGVKIASGFDAGTREAHGNNASEVVAIEQARDGSARGDPLRHLECGRTDGVAGPPRLSRAG